MWTSSDKHFTGEIVFEPEGGGRVTLVLTGPLATLNTEVFEIFSRAWTGGTHLHCPVKMKDWWMGGEYTGCSYVGDLCYGDTGYLTSVGILKALQDRGSAAAFKEMVEIYKEWMRPDE